MKKKKSVFNVTSERHHYGSTISIQVLIFWFLKVPEWCVIMNHQKESLPVTIFTARDLNANLNLHTQYM